MFGRLFGRSEEGEGNEEGVSGGLDTPINLPDEPIDALVSGMDAELRDEVERHLRHGRESHAVRLVRERMGLTYHKAVQLVQAYGRSIQ